MLIGTQKVYEPLQPQFLVVSSWKWFFSIAVAVSRSDGSPEICFVKYKAHLISHTGISPPNKSIYRISLNYLAFSAFLCERH